MIPGLAISFASPALLAALAALPVIWWLLRLTPPRPVEEVFPPLKVLARVLKNEDTPHKSPWWLTLLRLLIAALVILALAGPILNPQAVTLGGGKALAVVVDNGWASAPDWPRRAETTRGLIEQARNAGAPVVLAFTAEKASAEAGPFEAGEALKRLDAAVPRPVPTDRAAAFGRVAAALQEQPDAELALLTDDIATPADETAFNALLAAKPARINWYAPGDDPAPAVTGIENNADAMTVTLARLPDANAVPVRLAALDDKGRRIAEADALFAANDTEAKAAFAVPFELRNDFALVVVDGARHAGGTHVLDENARRRRVALLSGSDADKAQPLLAPLFYLRRALAPFADLVEPADADLTRAVPEILDRKPAVIVMADIGVMPDEARTALTEWIEAGGTLVRFAGPRLAASTDEDDLLPVRLRAGERALGGALSWTQPQPVSEFPPNGAFAGLTPPQEVTVSRQVLAEPGPGIVDMTWANLADGTPLVTGAKRGKGTLVLFHVAPDATWSTLPISGSFVEMLSRIVQLSRNAGSVAAGANGTQQQALAPWRMISADGGLTQPSPEARPLNISAGRPAVNIENPPGLYGAKEGVVAHNLLAAGDKLERLTPPATATPLVRAAYAAGAERDMKAWLIVAALALLAVDSLAVLWLSGGIRPVRFTRKAATGALLALAVSGTLLASTPGAQAQTFDDSRPGDPQIIDAINVTRIGYVLTGVPATDATTRAGLEGLSRFLKEKTALEPGEPAGLDIDRDELSLYPLIYWPIEADAPMPDAAALARIEAYMKQGGSVLFDTRDAFSGDLGGATPAGQRLRDILAAVNVPPLEPVPADHVLTKSFFILSSFPGRYDASPLWVEASLDSRSQEGRPVRTGDGVSPILITGNDFAGAWAEDNAGNPLLPIVPSNELQRIYAFRAGVNIMMYMLTGNYKSDQVHVPALLERLGQ